MRYPTLYAPAILRLDDYLVAGVEPFTDGSVKAHVFANSIFLDIRVRIDRGHPDLPDHHVLTLPAELYNASQAPPVIALSGSNPVPVTCSTSQLQVPSWAVPSLADLPAANLAMQLSYERRQA